MVPCTFNFFISLESSRTLLVPKILVATAERKFSSKRTVAAPWNTWLMSSISRRRSDVSSPKPGRLQSPFTITTLWRNLGIWSFSFPKSCNSEHKVYKLGNVRRAQHFWRVRSVVSLHVKYVNSFHWNEYFEAHYKMYLHLSIRAAVDDHRDIVGSDTYKR